MDVTLQNLACTCQALCSLYCVVIWVLSVHAKELWSANLAKTEPNLNLLNARKTVGQLIKFQGCNKNTNYSVITIDRK